MSRAVAMASAALRRLAAASRPTIAARAFSAAPVAVARRPVLPFRPSPALLFPTDLSRGYARGRRATVGSDDDEDLNDDDEEEEWVFDSEDSDEDEYKDMALGSESDMPEEEFGESDSDSEIKRPRRR